MSRAEQLASWAQANGYGFVAKDLLVSLIKKVQNEIIDRLSCPNFGPQIMWGSGERTEPRPCGYCESCMIRKDYEEPSGVPHHFLPLLQSRN